MEALLDPRMQLNGKLKALSEVIDWSPLGKLASKVRSATMGRKPYDALAMLAKALYLASLYDLSDPGAGSGADRPAGCLSACSAGFALDEATPDETTLCRFRNDFLHRGGRAFGGVCRR